MAWAPEQHSLHDLLQLLRGSMSANNQFHHELHEKLLRLNEHPEFNSYLVYILTQLTGEEEPVRAAAGLMLKNNIAAGYARLHPSTKQVIKDSCLAAIGDPMVLVRSTVANIITTIVTRSKLHDWPELLPSLVQRLDSPSYDELEGAFCALHRICEDGVREERDQNNELFETPMHLMVPVFLRHFNSPHERIRVYAVSCVTLFYTARPQNPFLIVHLNTFIQGLYDHAMDKSVNVRRNVCQALVMLLERHPQHLMPQMNTIVEYMIMCTQDDEDSVALEACEFWLAVSEMAEADVVMHPFLARLVPVLIRRMAYTDQDLKAMTGVRDDYNVPDRPEDIRPRFHTSRSHQQQHLADQAAQHRQSMARNMSEGDVADAADVEADDDDGDMDDDEPYSEWNIRKCSAAALDILATVFQDDILPFLLPIMRELLVSPDWKQRECGILALGAVAEGCFSGLEPHLPDLVPYLVRNLRDPKPLVRSITCWTLSRYAHWCVHRSRKDQYLQPLMHELLERVLDTNKRVQEAACSAFAQFEEEAQLELVPYLEYILDYLMRAYSIYQNKNLVILYDAMGTLADSVGKHLGQEPLIVKFMPPLLQRWSQLPDTNQELFPLLESLSSIAIAIGSGFLPFAVPVFDRCVRIITGTLLQVQQYELSLRTAPPDADRPDKPDKDFVVVSLDLLSGLAEGLGSSIESLVVSCNPPLPNLLHQCLMYFPEAAPEVRQSAFALIGDLAISCFPYMKPFMTEFVPILIRNLDPKHVSVCNNASWALGEISLQMGSDMRPYAPAIFAPLKGVLCRSPDLPPVARTLQENVAITIGRLGVVCPDIVSPHLEGFFVPWCQVMRNIRDNREKESAFTGLCLMIQLNPQAIVNDFVFFCDAIVSWSDTPAALRDKFAQILHGFISSIGGNWPQYYGSFPPELRRDLESKYLAQMTAPS